MAGSVELVDLVETEGISKKPTKAMKDSAQVTQCFNIMGFLEIFRSFYGIFRGESGDFKNIFGEIPERFLGHFSGFL